MNIHYEAIKHLLNEIKEAENISSLVLRHERIAYLKKLLTKERLLFNRNK